jgi:fructose-1,6-bisphosphatase I / sedoheptulose-1,7-bisphosphatase
MPDARKTLTRHTIEAEHRHPDSTGDFSGLLNAVSTAVKMIANQVNKGALVAAPGEGNGSTDVRKRLDVLSHEILIGETEWAGHLAAAASAEMAGFYPVPARYRRGKYLLVFDPLNGSGDIDVNIPVGTIFSVLRSPHPAAQLQAAQLQAAQLQAAQLQAAQLQAAQLQAADFLQPGTEQVCAGFALYGPSTMLVLTTGDGVDGFTLDRDIGAFVLTHPQLRIPGETSEFAINSSNERFWEPPVRRYVSECLAGRTGPRGKDFSMRWIASLVAEAFRILSRGGVFLYPADSKRPGQPGRLRLMHQANPIAFIVEQAGGLASTGRERLMESQPADLHQRVPVIFGSRAEVELIERYHRDQAEPSTDDFSLFNTRSLFRD